MAQLGDDPVLNHRVLQELLDSQPPGKLELPPGNHRLAEGLRVPGGWTVRGSSVADTWLISESRTGHPVLHVLGSDVAISDLGLRPAPADPGEHGGDRGTGLTIGEYLYAGTPEWISDVDVRRVHVDHGPLRTANAIGVMGAVRAVTLHDVLITGGYTGVAVHWGAAGADVSSITGPTYHPHQLTVSDLRVRDAIEGFYLSSVHNVRVTGACLRDVEMGFRLLPGDNTNRFVSSSEDVGARIEVEDVCVRWTGPRYAVRIAGWGRSEVDGVISVLAYRDSTVRNCRLAGTGTGDDWSPVRFERASGVELRDITVSTTAGDCCRLGVPD
ncbi:right-handed parallel beta-helix repeat-containing protein [Actinoplanes awajinensis]|uniref:Right handed beta helix domain-containing protein n=1 Tax=Actinoplanes awajinensis subsp. mycoplanecinus TaxID=135947 RepID=A0A101JSR3_9ACTN|nr:hypothetical protein [Actinoplanes awajinensis]KUL32384.1 hypothetical protein ADL15_20405 [Actinoplanes awajinensis subsp. mycoplanecinus]